MRSRGRSACKRHGTGLRDPGSADRGNPAASRTSLGTSMTVATISRLAAPELMATITRPGAAYAGACSGSVLGARRSGRLQRDASGVELGWA